MPIKDFLWELTVVTLKDAINPKHWGCVIYPEHIAFTLTFSKCNDLGHYLNDRFSDFHLCYYIRIYEVVSRVFPDFCWISEPCKQPPLMMVDLMDKQSDTNPV